MSGGDGPKMINQYFNVYALRRVRTAGYATAIDIDEIIKQLPAKLELFELRGNNTQLYLYHHGTVQLPMHFADNLS